MTNEYILISGSTSGIGLGTAIELSKDYRIILNGFETNEVIERLKQKLNTPEKHLIWSYNFRQPEGIFDSFSNLLLENNAVVEKFIHCAGIAPVMAQKSCNYNMMLNVFNINFFSASEIIRVLLNKNINKKMLNNVLFISSVFSQFGAKGHSQYGATKAALNGFMKSLAVELAPTVRVNTIMPGAIVTPLAKKALNDDEISKKIEQTYLLGIGQIKEVSNIISFLISENAKWITGQNYIIDGGRTINLNQK